MEKYFKKWGLKRWEELVLCLLIMVTLILFILFLHAFIAMNTRSPLIIASGSLYGKCESDMLHWFSLLKLPFIL